MPASNPKTIEALKLLYPTVDMPVCTVRAELTRNHGVRTKTENKNIAA